MLKPHLFEEVNFGWVAASVSPRHAGIQPVLVRMLFRFAGVLPYFALALFV